MELPDINGLIDLMIFGFFYVKKEGESKKQSAANDNQLTHLVLSGEWSSSE